MKRGSPYIKETPPLLADGTIHSPLHSERGRGGGCRGGGGEAVEGDKGEVVFPPFEGLGEAFWGIG